jgi:hypothetical protein
MWLLTLIIKGTFVHFHAMKAYSGEYGIDLLILNVETVWSGMVNFTPWPLHLREITPVPIK